MIIGISGKKQSGKYTVAKIIQGFDIWKKNLALQTEYPLSNVFVRAYVLNRVSIYVSSWQVKKFSGKLKEIVSILTGFTLEELEVEKIKNTTLFESYQLINKKLEIIETFGSMKELVDSLDYLRTLFLKIYTNEQINSFFKQKTINITPRYLLQTIGTNIGREINPNIWVTLLMNDYKKNIFNPSKYYLSENPNTNVFDFPNWIITDVRFSNEVKAIKEKEGIVIRLNREGIETVNHLSETALDTYTDFDYTIDNNNCIDCLIEKVKEILKHEKII